jgi:hypothetical protein
MDVHVKLVAIKGNQEEFADMIGTVGMLDLTHGKERYRATGGDSLRLMRKRVSWKDGQIRVFTTFGNVFTFRALVEAPS